MGEDWARGKIVDSELFLKGRERPLEGEVDEILGRQDGDAQKLFPQYTHASPATVGEVRENGKVLQLWNFSQLETLNQYALRTRALAIRDFLGEDHCPPLPSVRCHDLVRWIMKMQEQITNQSSGMGRSGGYGTGHFVPKSFVQETKEIERLRALPSEPLPPSIRAPPPPNAVRDNYKDLIFQQSNKEDVNIGIQTGRLGGEGRRHIHPKPSMEEGIGVHSQKGHYRDSEGRRYIPERDSLMAQKKENETRERESMTTGAGGPAPIQRPANHISEDHMAHFGCTAADEPPIGGERKRHSHIPKDNFVSPGTYNCKEAVHGKKHLDNFHNKTQLEKHGGRQDEYRGGWRQNPNKLMGASMLC